jgi:hypothetical protein
MMFKMSKTPIKTMAINNHQISLKSIRYLWNMCWGHISTTETGHKNNQLLHEEQPGSQNIILVLKI